jgi:hypothetical protein
MAPRLRRDAHRGRIEVRRDALDDVSDAVDDGFHQAREHRRRRIARGRMTFGVRDEAAERQRIHVTVRDQLDGRENERDLRALGKIGVELRDDRDRHVERAVFFVETVGRFDLAHLVARRHVDRQEALDLLFLARRGLEQVQPHGLGGDGRTGPQLESREALGLRYEGAQHRVGAWKRISASSRSWRDR